MYVAESLDIPTERIFCWCDSTAVLGWLRASPEKHSVYVKNHVAKVTDCVPSSQRRYVATDVNPADAASRGVFPEELTLRNFGGKVRSGSPIHLLNGRSIWTLVTRQLKSKPTFLRLYMSSQQMNLLSYYCFLLFTGSLVLGLCQEMDFCSQSKTVSQQFAHQ